MKRLTLILVFFIVMSSLGIAQSTVLMNEIESNKKEMSGKGYTLLDYGGFDTNYDLYMRFDPQRYHDGYAYYFVIYLEGCSYCDVGLFFQRTSDNAVDELTLEIKRAGEIVRAVYGVKQDKTSVGQVYAYAKSNSNVYTYGLLFRKPAN
jgi:hypothetical protein